MLRDDADRAAPTRSPQPGLADLDELVRAMRAAGLDVALSTQSGHLRPSTAAVDLSAYRIVQESLTNVLKHAGPARVDRPAHRAPATRSEIEVTDDGLGGSAPNAARDGKGLIGMRERVGAGRRRVVRRAGRPVAGGRVRASLPARTRRCRR